jgi:type IV pilus assembly protein PilC
LKQDSIIITDLQKIGRKENEKVKNPQKINFFAKKVNPEDVAIMTKKLSTMLRSGLAILQTLKMIKDQVEDKNLQIAVDRIYADVESGTELSKAFGKHPAIFDNIYVNMVRAGESSGKLDTFLQRLVISMNKSIKIRKKIKSAMMYPMILLIVATLVLAIMMVFVVPVFVKMFGSVGSELPAPTLFVVTISDFMRNPFGGGLLLGLIIAGIFIFKKVVRDNYELRKKWHLLLLRMPLIGNLILKSSLAQIAMVYGNLTDAGVPVIEALDITSASSKNEALKEAIQIAKRGVFSGEPLSGLLSKIKIIPITFSQLVLVGEETGNMSEMLTTISSYYEEEFDDAVDKFSQMLEPIMIVFLGGVIGFILVAMYLPIFKLGAVVTS